MLSSSHKMFGMVVSKTFDVDVDWNWARAPDYGIWFKSPKVNKYLHRFTLHGLPNIYKTIEIIRDKELLDFKISNYGAILCLVVSHNYLDLFNGPIMLSYPYNYEIKYIKEQIPYYKGYSIKDPKDVKELFTDIVNSFDSIEDLTEEMVNEYKSLPQKHSGLTQTIIDFYKKSENNP